MTPRKCGRAGPTSLRAGLHLNTLECAGLGQAHGRHSNTRLGHPAQGRHTVLVLVSLTSDMPYTVVYNSRKCGLCAWRRLNHLYKPQNARSNMRLLRRILVQPRSTLEGLRAALGKWEADLVEYVQRGNKDLDDAQKITILSMVPGTGRSLGDEHRSLGHVPEGAD